MQVQQRGGGQRRDHQRRSLRLLLDLGRLLLALLQLPTVVSPCCQTRKTSLLPAPDPPCTPSAPPLPLCRLLLPCVLPTTAQSNPLCVLRGLNPLQHKDPSFVDRNPRSTEDLHLVVDSRRVLLQRQRATVRLHVALRNNLYLH